MYHVSHSVVQHFEIRVLDVWWDHLHFTVRQDSRCVHDGIQYGLCNGNNTPGLGQEILGMMAFGYGIIERRHRIETLDRRYPYKDSALSFGQCLY